MEYPEYRKYDAVGLADLVRRGEVSASELLELAIARASEVNPHINAVIRPMHEIARARAASPLDGPFAGVPFLIKDLGQDFAGLPTGSGSRALADRPMPEHSEVVTRWLASGLVIFGKTNTPELGFKAVTEPEANGPTRNPWNTDHTPGGSSGGSAAAVAAGVVPVAGASDGGGSIRIPAACCGLVGLKAGRGIVPNGPSHSEHLHGAATDGVVSRSVRDSAVMLDVLAGADPAAPYLPALPDVSYLELSRRDPGRLRIGFTSASPLHGAVSPDAAAAVEDAATMLSGLGHDVEPVVTGIDEAQLSKDFLAVWFASVANRVERARRVSGSGLDGFELDTRILAALGRSMSAPDYIATLDRWHDHVRALSAFHRTYDLLLTPTLAQPPARIGELATPNWLAQGGKLVLALHATQVIERFGIVDRIARENLRRTPYTQLANVTGRPAISVPTYWTSDGLPLGVQFVGPLGGEGMLLALASQIEAERPWADREPPL